jgi:hypothetical protein
MPAPRRLRAFMRTGRRLSARASLFFMPALTTGLLLDADVSGPPVEAAPALDATGPSSAVPGAATETVAMTRHRSSGEIAGASPVLPSRGVVVYAQPLRDGLSRAEIDAAVGAPAAELGAAPGRALP